MALSFSDPDPETTDERERRAALEVTQQFVDALLAPFAIEGGRVPTQAQGSADTTEDSVQESHLIQ